MSILDVNTGLSSIDQTSKLLETLNNLKAHQSGISRTDFEYANQFSDQNTNSFWRGIKVDQPVDTSRKDTLLSLTPEPILQRFAGPILTSNKNEISVGESKLLQKYTRILNNVETNRLKSITKLVDMENLIRHQILSVQISNIRRKYQIALFNILTHHGLEKFDPQLQEIINGLRGCEHFLLRENETVWEFGTLSPEGDYKTFYSLLDKRRKQIILTNQKEERNDRFNGTDGKITIDIQKSRALKRVNLRVNNKQKTFYKQPQRFSPYGQQNFFPDKGDLTEVGIEVEVIEETIEVDITVEVIILEEEVPSNLEVETNINIILTLHLAFTTTIKKTNKQLVD